MDGQAPGRTASRKFRRGHVDANPTRPLRSPHRRSQSYAVISLKTPDPDALGKKSKNQRRDLCLKSVADGHARRRIRLIDKFADTPSNQIGLRRFLHVAFDCVPSFGEPCLISRLAPLAFRHGIVKSVQISPGWRSTMRTRESGNSSWIDMVNDAMAAFAAL